MLSSRDQPVDPLREKGCGCRAAPGMVRHSRDLPSLENKLVEVRPKGGVNQPASPMGPREVLKWENSIYYP